MIYTLSFWGSQGRLGVIGAGELAGRHIFVFPDTLPDWWTMSYSRALMSTPLATTARTIRSRFIP